MCSGGIIIEAKNVYSFSLHEKEVVSVLGSLFMNANFV